ncbi:hypothetical protein LWI28_025447 [Acer negundo]|uniref:Uncharacterized protein n=1 Tax=Acer negundo TaxID=4023 RepID=A0AAD5P473_ACENE|nr:hypothetical protein LWI28_025447 [Acer negundo]
MFCALYMQMSLFRWKVSDHEKSSAYYKSLMLEDVIREDREDAMEEGDVSIHQSKTRTSGTTDDGTGSLRKARQDDWSDGTGD